MLCACRRHVCSAAQSACFSPSVCLLTAFTPAVDMHVRCDMFDTGLLSLCVDCAPNAGNTASPGIEITNIADNTRSWPRPQRSTPHCIPALSLGYLHCQTYRDPILHFLLSWISNRKCSLASRSRAFAGLVAPNSMLSCDLLHVQGAHERRRWRALQRARPWPRFPVWRRPRATSAPAAAAGRNARCRTSLPGARSARRAACAAPTTCPAHDASSCRRCAPLLRPVVLILSLVWLLGGVVAEDLQGILG